VLKSTIIEVLLISGCELKALPKDVVLVISHFFPYGLKFAEFLNRYPSTVSLVIAITLRYSESSDISLWNTEKSYFRFYWCRFCYMKVLVT